MGTTRLRTADYSDEQRRLLGDAVAEARRAAGHAWRSTFVRAHPSLGMRSLATVERGDPRGVGVTVLEEIGRVLGIYHPGWNKDTPRDILDGGPIPDLTSVTAPAIVDEDNGLEDADEDALLLIISDQSKLGTQEHLEALAILHARGLLTKEAFAYGLVVNRKVRKAREAAAREIADLQQSLTDRVRSDLSG